MHNASKEAACCYGYMLMHSYDAKLKAKCNKCLSVFLCFYGLMPEIN